MLKPLLEKRKIAPKLPWSKAIRLIIVSTLLISGTAYAGWFTLCFLEKKNQKKDQYQIKAILQKGPNREFLKGMYLAEILGLSVDNPINLYAFDAKRGEKLLLQSPIIRDAQIKKIKPETLFVEYSVRQPIAYLGDYANAAIDENGVIFPIYPFLTPKRLPELYFGFYPPESNPLHTLHQWGDAIRGDKVKLAFKILGLLSAPPYNEKFRLIRVDLSEADNDSLGQRQIVVMVEDQWIVERSSSMAEPLKNEFDTQKNDNTPLLCNFPRILRLSHHFEDELRHYLILRDSLIADEKKISEKLSNESSYRSPPVTIDLRIPHIAYIKRSGV